MMEYRVDIRANGSVRTVMAEEGANLLEVLGEAGILPYTPCGGRGTCGKCAVRVEGGGAEPSENERRLLGERLAKGFRLACSFRIGSDICIHIDSSGEQAVIMTAGTRRQVVMDPLVRKKYVELPHPSLDDQRPDLERLLDMAGLSGSGTGLSNLSGIEMKPGMLRMLPALLRSSGYRVTAVEAWGRLLSVEAGNTTSRLYGTAFDIGTTTVAAYLYCLESGKLLSAGSMMNPQRKFGADVISRIDRAKTSPQAADEMRSLITECVNELTGQLARNAGIGVEDIYAAVFSGNTTMLHLLYGLDASGIAVSPFIPVTCRTIRLDAGELGIGMNASGQVILLPCVSAYIGADTVSGVLSSGLYERDGYSLLVDIGTNGEIVLGGRDRLIACSAAAGPAFEGANITFGMGGVTGAVDSFTQGFRYTVIGNAAPRGICGSGIVDAVAALLDAGAIDETGALADDTTAAGLPQEVRERLTVTDGIRSFILVPEHESGTSGPITITQKDIREIQNAKAAIAAGIETLMAEAGISYDDIDRVFLAGGFGSTINVRSAARIGLLPVQLTDRVEAVGNASGSGASECLLSQRMLSVAEQIAKKVRYVELSASAIFSDRYIENMIFM